MADDDKKPTKPEAEPRTYEQIRDPHVGVDPNNPAYRNPKNRHRNGPRSGTTDFDPFTGE